MIFSDLYKSPKSPLSKLRHTNPVGLDARNAGYDADLLSKDKTRQKEAIKRVLAETVRNDWEFKWPRPGVPRPAPKDTAPAAAPGSASQGPAPETSGVDALSNNADPSNSTAEPALDTADENELESSDNDDDENDDSDTESVYSCMSEDLAHYQPRLEWTSDLSDDEPAIASSSPFRFNNPDSVGMVVRASAAAKQAKRRRAQRSEMEWNDGLACFNARRDAWTGARTVRVKPSATSPTSPTSPRRSLWRLGSSKSDVTTPPPHTDSAIASANASPPSPGATHSRNSQLYQPESAGTSDGYSSSNSSPPSKDSNQAYPVKTLIPVPRPLLPVGNPMRASISPAMYTSLYDKVVVASLQPSCPINLSDMIRSCVVGWKRDGEWPPRPMEIPAAALVVVRKKKEDRRDSAKDRRGSAATLGSTGRRLSLGGLLGRATADDKEKDKDAKKDGSGSGEGGNSKSFRRSIQRVLGIGHGHSPSTSVNQPKEPAAV